MKKRRMRLLSLILAAVMTFTTTAGNLTVAVNATEEGVTEAVSSQAPAMVPVSGEGSSQAEPSVQASAPATEAAGTPASEASTTVSEPAAPEATVSAPAAEEATAEASENKTEEAWSDSFDVTEDGIKIKAEADPGVIPAGAKLSVTKVESTAVDNAAEAAVEKTVSDDTEVKAAYTYDIKIKYTDKDGNEQTIEPDGDTVRVTFAGIDELQEADTDATVVYVADDASATDIIDTKVEGDDAVIDAEHFSTYSIVITVNKNESDFKTELLVMSTNSTMTMEELINKSFNGDVKDITDLSDTSSTKSSVIGVTKANKITPGDTDWRHVRLTAEKAGTATIKFTYKINNGNNRKGSLTLQVLDQSASDSWQDAYFFVAQTEEIPKDGTSLGTGYYPANNNECLKGSVLDSKELKDRYNDKDKNGNEGYYNFSGLDTRLYKAPSNEDIYADIINKYNTDYTPEDITWYKIYKKGSGKIHVDGYVYVHTVTYDANGGNAVSPSSVTVKNGKSVTLPNATRAGYTFAGWYADASDGDKIGDAGASYTPENKKTLYAHWKVSTVKVLFETNGGSTVSTETVNSGENVNRPSDPTKTGYKFAGWYQESTCQKAWDFSNDKVTADITLYAKWTPITYTIKFNKNNDTATGSMADQTMTYDQYTALSANGFGLKHNTFIGWAISADASVTYTDKQSVENLSSTSGDTVVLYAKYSRHTVNVTFDANGGAYIDGSKQKTVSEGTTEDSLTMPETPSMNGYEFTGWFTDRENGNEITEDTEVPDTAATYYAHWKDAEWMPAYFYFYTAAAKPAGDTITVVGQTWYPDKAVYYSLEGQVSGKIYNSYVKTEYYNSYSISSGDYSVPSDKVSALISEKNLKFTASDINWYHIVGQYDGTAVPHFHVDGYVVVHTLSYNGNGGNGAPAEETGIVRTTVSDGSTLTRTGYDFKGWNTAADGTGTAYEAGKEITLEADTTLYAQWEAKNVTISYNATEGGKVSQASETVSGDGTAAGSAAAVSDNNYRFVNWTDEHGKAVSISAAFVPARNVSTQLYDAATYTANFAKIVYTVSFDGNGGTLNGKGSVSKDSGTPVLPNEFPAVSKNGSFFAGWLDSDNKAVSAGYIVTKDQIFTAQWNKAVTGGKLYVVSPSSKAPEEKNGTILGTGGINYCQVGTAGIDPSTISDNYIDSTGKTKRTNYAGNDISSHISTVYTDVNSGYSFNKMTGVIKALSADTYYYTANIKDVHWYVIKTMNDKRSDIHVDGTVKWTKTEERKATANLYITVSGDYTQEKTNKDKAMNLKNGSWSNSLGTASLNTAFVDDGYKEYAGEDCAAKYLSNFNYYSSKDGMVSFTYNNKTYTVPENEILWHSIKDLKNGQFNADGHILLKVSGSIADGNVTTENAEQSVRFLADSSAMTFTPDAAHYISGVTVNGKGSDYTLNPDGSYTFEAQQGVTKDIAVNVTTAAKTAVTITPEDAEKVYNGSALTPSDFSVTGVSKDSVTKVRYDGSQTYAGEGISSVVSYNLADAYKYTVTTGTGRLVVKKKPVTISVNDFEKIYGTDDPAFNGTVSDMVSSNDLGTVGYTRQDKTESVGKYEISADYTENPNYDVKVIPGYLTIKESAFAFSAVFDAITYDGQAHKITTSASIDGVKFSVYSDEKCEQEISNNFVDAGTRYVYVKAAANDNYEKKAAIKVPVVINKRTLTVTAATASRLYDTNELTAGSFTYDGLAAGQTISAKVTGAITLPGSSTNSISDIVIKDADGNDVTSNYSIKAVNGILTVEDAKGAAGTVTVTAGSLSWKYDGKEHSISDNGYTYEISYNKKDRELPAVQAAAAEQQVGLTVVARAEGTIKNAGSADSNVSNIKVYDNGTDVTSSFTVAAVSGKLTVTKRKAVLTSATASKEYDSKALSADSVEVTGDGFVSGEGADYKFTGSQLFAGSSDNSFDYTLKDNTLSANYDISKAAGKLTVTNDGREGRVLTITTPSADFVYDGSSHSARTYTTGGSAMSDDKIVVTMGTALTDAGTAANELSCRVINADGTDVTGYYTIVPVKGTITVSQRPITVTAASASTADNGSALTAAGFTYTKYGTDMGLLSGNRITATVTGSQSGTGSSKNIVKNVMIKDVNGNNVTADYLITTKNGTLTVNAAAASDTGTSSSTTAATTGTTAATTGTTAAVPAAGTVTLPPALAAAVAGVRRVLNNGAAAGNTAANGNAAADNGEVADDAKVPEASAKTDTADTAKPAATTAISEDKVPLGVHEEKCFIHWIILLLALLYSVYGTVRIIARAKKIHELEDGREADQKA